MSTLTRFTRRIAPVLVVGSVTLLPAVTHAQSTLDQFRKVAAVNFLRAQLDPTTNARVEQIWWQLFRRTGHVYRVLPSQNFNIGQALPFGVILLDLSTAGDPSPEVTAFFLAHEWAHQELGHVNLTVAQQGAIMMALGPTANEDSADRWAARFVKDAGYDTGPIYDYLCALPGGGPGDVHSSGPERAHIAQAAIRDRGGDVCAGDSNDRGSGPGGGGGAFADGLRQFMDAAPTHFANIRGRYLRTNVGDRVFTVTVSLPGFDACELYSDASIDMYYVTCKAATDGLSYDDVLSAVSAVVGSDGAEENPSYGRQTHTWSTKKADLRLHETSRGSIFLDVSTSS